MLHISPLSLAVISEKIKRLQHHKDILLLIYKVNFSILLPQKIDFLTYYIIGRAVIASERFFPSDSS